MTTLLEINNLSVTLDNQKIHTGLSFAVQEGEILTILGPNGAGKSVLIKAILGLIPYQGEINWQKKSRIGYLPQSLTQLSMKNLPLTVLDFFQLKDNVYSTTQITQALKQVGLDSSLLNHVACNLSGGQFQRMLLSWVLIDKPDILFLDEPTSGVDIGAEENIYSLLNELRKQNKLTIVMVTHDIHVVYAHSDTVLCLKRKDHACIGKPRTILTPQMLEKIFGMEIKYYQHKL